MEVIEEYYVVDGTCYEVCYKSDSDSDKWFVVYDDFGKFSPIRSFPSKDLASSFALILCSAFNSYYFAHI